MVKPKFKVRLQGSIKVNGKPKSKPEAHVKRKNILEKELQIEDAVSWCRNNNCKGHAALKTGMFPLIKDRGTIDRRLAGLHQNIKKEHLRILTMEEEKSIVQYIKNKNRCYQGILRKHVENLIIDVLKIRQHCNSLKAGRKYKKLSRNAKQVLLKGR